MKAITIHQPYAELIASGAKRVENRTWQTHYRGEIAIHAAKKGRGARSEERELPHRAIVAVAEIVACVHIDDVRRCSVGEYAWLADHEHATGPWCWVLVNVRRLTKPVECPGRQSLWNVPADVLPKIKRRLPR
jgi:hypothetical protein